MIQVKPSVLRHWETEFKSLNPKKSRNVGRRYTTKDIELVKEIHHLLKVERYTIEGARRKIGLKKEVSEKKYQIIDKLKTVKIELETLLKKIED